MRTVRFIDASDDGSVVLAKELAPLPAVCALCRTINDPDHYTISTTTEGSEKFCLWLGLASERYIPEVVILDGHYALIFNRR